MKLNLKKHITLVSLFIFVIVFCVGCGKSEEPKESEEPMNTAENTEKENTASITEPVITEAVITESVDPVDTENIKDEVTDVTPIETNIDETPEYTTSEESTDDSLNELINDGFVVMKNGSVISGEEKWLEFVEKTKAKEPAEISVAYYFTLTGKVSKKLYEQIKDDYPMAYLHLLKYDGENFIYTPLQKSDSSEEKYVITQNDEIGYEETYKYLKHYTEKAPSDTALYYTFDKYVLVNDDTVTWDDIWNGMISNEFGAGIKNSEVFNKYDYKEGVDPDKLIIIDIDF